ncbi:MAG: hypothetical protein ACK4GT_10070 [Pararhodobacter sp.]
MSFSLTIRTARDLAEEAQVALQARIAAAIDARVEGQARELGYNSAAHLAGYAASTVPDWAAEARAFIAWRDQVWQVVFALHDRHSAAQTLPTVEDVTGALPAWKG